MRNRSIGPVILIVGSMATLGCHASPPRTALAWASETSAPTASVESSRASDPSPARVESAFYPEWNEVTLDAARVQDAAPQAVPLSEPAKPLYAEWTWRAWAGIVGRYVESDNVTFQDPNFGTSELDWPDDAFGFGFDVERRFSKLLGLDLGVGYTNLETEFSHSVGTGTQTDDLGVIPVWLALNLHVVDNESLDIYFGPQIAYFIYLDDLSYDVPGVGTFDVDTDNEFPSLGFLVGTDVSLGGDWALNFAFRFQDADADSDHELPLDPTFVTLGVSRSF